MEKGEEAEMIVSASLKFCLLYLNICYFTISKHPYAVLSFSVMILVNTKLDVLGLNMLCACIQENWEEWGSL